MKDTLYEELVMLIYTNLGIDCPVMSGNMKSHIDFEEFGSNFTRLAITAPSYDIDEWRKTKQIVFTNEYDYAVSVNQLGAFSGKSTKSKHWANKSVVNACQIKAKEYGAEVIVNVEL